MAVCGACENEMVGATSCVGGIDPSVIIPWDHAAPRKVVNCPDCSTPPGGTHHPGCDVERCSQCKGRSIQCEPNECQRAAPNCWIDCAYCEAPEGEACGLSGEGCVHDPTKVRWTGVWPGVLEARARGWYSRMVPGKIGWHRCHKDDEGASEDLNRWARVTHGFDIDPLSEIPWGAEPWNERVGKLIEAPYNPMTPKHLARMDKAIKIEAHATVDCCWLCARPLYAVDMGEKFRYHAQRVYCSECVECITKIPNP